MNLLLPLLLFSVAFMVPHSVIYGQVQVDEIAANSPAARAEIVVGDTILEVNGKQVNSVGDLQRYIQLNLGQGSTEVAATGRRRRDWRCRENGLADGGPPELSFLAGDTDGRAGVH